MGPGMANNPMGIGGTGIPNPQQMGQMNPMSAMQNMIFNNLYQSNPQFRQFADSMRGKTPEQAFQEYGLDYSQFMNVDPNQVRSSLGI